MGDPTRWVEHFYIQDADEPVSPDAEWIGPIASFGEAKAEATRLAHERDRAVNILSSSPGRGDHVVVRVEPPAGTSRG